MRDPDQDATLDCNKGWTVGTCATTCALRLPIVQGAALPLDRRMAHAMDSN
jgi:hypothetical protein